MNTPQNTDTYQMGFAPIAGKDAEIYQPNFELLFHEDPNVNGKAIDELRTFGIRTNGHILPRGNATETAPSLLPPGTAERLEAKLPELTHALRQEYVFVLSCVGGEEEVGIAKRLLVQILGGDTPLEKEDLELVQGALHVLGDIGGPEAFHTLIALREYPHETIAFWANAEARNLCVRGIPHDDVGDYAEPSTTEIHRQGDYRRD